MQPIQIVQPARLDLSVTFGNMFSAKMPKKVTKLKLDHLIITKNYIKFKK